MIDNSWFSLLFSAIKIIVINVGFSSLTYNTGFFNIRNLKNFITDVAELINSDSSYICITKSILSQTDFYIAIYPKSYLYNKLIANINDW